MSNTLLRAGVGRGRPELVLTPQLVEGTTLFGGGEQATQLLGVRWPDGEGRQQSRSEE